MDNTEKQIRLFVSEFLVHLGIDFTDIEIEKKDDTQYRVNIVSDEPSLLIGHRGENLMAMQKLLKVAFHQKFDENTEVLFDIDNYRKRQEENVLSITEQKIQEVRQTRVQSALPPMSAYFRRVVHLFVRDGDFDDIETESMGDGNYRQVVIKLKA